MRATSSPPWPSLTRADLRYRNECLAPRAPVHLPDALPGEVSILAPPVRRWTKPTPASTSYSRGSPLADKRPPAPVSREPLAERHCADASGRIRVMSVCRLGRQANCYHCTRMEISRIEIRNFRSFRQFELNLDGESMFVIGENAGGKTSLLTAVA